MEEQVTHAPSTTEPSIAPGGSIAHCPEAGHLHPERVHVVSASVIILTTKDKKVKENKRHKSLGVSS